MALMMGTYSPKISSMVEPEIPGRDEDVSSQERGQVGDFHIGPLAAGGVHRRDHQHQHDPQHQEQEPAYPAKAFLLFPDNQRKGKNGKTQEQGTQFIDPAGEKTGDHQHRRTHADDPAHAQLGQETDALPFQFPVAVGEHIQGTDEFVVKAQHKGNGAAGYPGDAVGQGHAETPDHVQEQIHRCHPFLGAGPLSFPTV